MKIGLFSEFFHRRNESDIWAASRTLGGGHFDGAFRGGATAILFRAVIAGALLARNLHFFGHGFVARDSFLYRLNHAAFAAGVNFFSNRVVVTGFDLMCLGSVASGSAAESKHRTAGGKTK